MQNQQQDRPAWTNHRLDSPRFGSTVLAFQPIQASRRSPFREGDPALPHSPHADAEIVRFQPRGRAMATKPAPGQHAKAAAAPVPHSTESDEEYHHRMLINLLSAAWVTVVMTGGYFTLSGLVPMP